jgi:predicted amidohydrolase YtcJ
MAARLTAYVVVGIVAATLIAGLIVGAQRDDSDGPVDLIVRNAKVYTAGTRGTMAEAVAIRGNQILRVGSDRDVSRLARPQTTVIDAQGAAVLPGFNDSHVHFITGGLELDRIDLSDATSLDDVQQRLRVWADANPDAAWVLGRGWFSHSFPGNQPTRQQLDAVIKGRPAQILSHDGRTSWVNTRALRLAGITRKTPDPPNGVIVKDPRTGEPTGVLKEAAVSLVSRRLPQPTWEERARALRAAIDEAHRNGVTSIQNATGSADEFELYADALRSGDLSLRVYSALSVDGVLDEPAITALDALAKRFPDDPLFKAGAVKIMLDGAIDTHSAAMLEPYVNTTAGARTDDSGNATEDTPRIAADDLNRMVRLLDAHGWQVLTHAVGDRAVRMSLDAYEHAARSNPPPKRGRRHRVEHLELTDSGDLLRFGALGVIASMQPFQGSPSPGELDEWARNLGVERRGRAWGYGSIAHAGGHLAFGSDWPLASMNPLLGLHTAVNRTTPDGLPEGGWYPDERITLKQAIDAYTSGAAWASFDEQRKGSLAAGMLADLVVLSDDIFDAPTSRLATTRVMFTIFDGKVVYQRDGTQTN